MCIPTKKVRASNFFGGPVTFKVHWPPGPVNIKRYCRPLVKVTYQTSDDFARHDCYDCLQLCNPPCLVDGLDSAFCLWLKTRAAVVIKCLVPICCPSVAVHCVLWHMLKYTMLMGS